MALDAMSACISDLKGWLIANKLQLNDDKTKVLLVSSPFGRHPPPLLSLAVNNFLISPTGSVRNLGVILDSHLTMEEHICSVRKRSFFPLRRIARIRKFLRPNTAARLALSFVVPCLTMQTRRMHICWTAGEAHIFTDQATNRLQDYHSGLQMS